MSEYTNRIVYINSDDQDVKPEIKIIDLTLGVFFDGTANNKYNLKNLDNMARNPDVRRHFDEQKDRYVNVPKKGRTASYFGTFSNVAELFEAYEIKEQSSDKIYIEGIGTAEPHDDGSSSERPDSTKGSALGTADTGINGKIQRACEMIAEKVTALQKTNNNYKQITIGTLTLDVFGFSRGAAAARSFVNRIEKPKPLYSAKEVNRIMIRNPLSMYSQHIQNNMETSRTEGFQVFLRHYLEMRHLSIKSIRVRFLGIFDTVASYGIIHTNDVNQLELSIPSSVRYVVHLVAADEYRKNFALTKINAGSPNWKEFILPGAHSDIGGGYNQFETEPVVMREEDWFRKSLFRGYLSLDELKEGEWISETCLKNINNGNNDLSLRVILNSYSKIPLDLMGQMAKKQGLVFATEAYDNMVKLSEFELHDSGVDFHPVRELEPVKQLVMGLNDGNDQLYRFGYSDDESVFVSLLNDDQWVDVKSIRSKYIHLSAWNDNTVGIIMPHKQASERRRPILEC